MLKQVLHFEQVAVPVSWTLWGDGRASVLGLLSTRLLLAGQWQALRPQPQHLWEPDITLLEQMPTTSQG